MAGECWFTGEPTVCEPEIVLRSTHTRGTVVSIAGAPAKTQL